MKCVSCNKHVDDNTKQTPGMPMCDGCKAGKTSEARNGDNLHCLVGPELFRFESFQQWVNKAASWFSTCGYPCRHAICVDAKGRICQYGEHFMTARDEDAFPVLVCMAREDDMPNAESEVSE